MRVLFASTQGAGHFRPLVPFIDACLRNGHEALVVGPPALDAKGYPFRAGAHPPDEELGPVWGSMPSQPPGQGDVIVIGTIFARLNVRAMLPALRRAIEEWKPDLVLREGAEYASAAAAELHGVRHVRVANGLATVEEAGLAIAAPALDEVLPGLARRIAVSEWLSGLPESVDAAPFPVRRFRDPAAGRPPTPLPDWWPGDDRPLVYVSFGSVAASFPPAAAVYPQALEAVADLPARVLFTVGGGDLELGSPPGNVHVERWISNEADVVAQSAVVVSHGGFGTMLGVLAAGTPLVVVPLFADQPQNAVRVAAAGAGVVSSVDGIRASVERVLADDSYRRTAARIAGEMRALPPVDYFFAA
jgi:UDP:flavonoid glycosyltransferase YjiC (YdhE family)